MSVEFNFEPFMFVVSEKPPICHHGNSMCFSSDCFSFLSCDHFHKVVRDRETPFILAKSSDLIPYRHNQIIMIYLSL